MHFVQGLTSGSKEDATCEDSEVGLTGFYKTKNKKQILLTVTNTKLDQPSKNQEKTNTLCYHLPQHKNLNTTTTTTTTTTT